ncbi:MAG: endonuclease YncB(thermonuclease family) [Candidatus Azotimanducaceae bacterium]|jgi:endonuclease YncB( thermonuclease family)
MKSLNTPQKTILIGLACLTLAGSLLQYLVKPTPALFNPIKEQPSTYEGKVINVTDGDKITISNARNEKIKVRLTGIDAPESEQPFGKDSTIKLGLIVADKEVRIDTIKKDSLGNVLGKVWVQPSDCSTCGKTLNANHAQLLAGMAWWDSQNADEQSPEDRGRYESAERESRNRKRGLWSESNPMAPWDWRRGLAPNLMDGAAQRNTARDD